MLSHDWIAHELGHLEPWLDAQGFAISRVYREDGLDLPAADLLVVMGSPTSVATGYRQPAADREVAMVAEWVSRDRPYLGVCFGAQVLACAMGGSVRRLPETIRGYLSIEAGRPGPAREAGPWVLWHEDAITGPADATVSGRLPHADLVFRRGRACGIQPHVEVTPDTLRRMARALGAQPSAYEPLASALAADDAAPERVRALLDSVLEASLGEPGDQVIDGHRPG
ncbi:MAG: gamma-glutamyl-gamma-aminobutyrate hydrolase family protein [Actinomycetota bacterium]|nr:gamma-glutamyl-gamma-aminobutyrate hydrolase family protein [Actinomycetota bacterium]